MQTNRILMVVTSSDRMGKSPEPTGSWLEEIAAPYYAFIDSKCDVTIASPRGGSAPLDPKGLEDANQTASTRRFEADIKAQRALGSTIKLSTITPANYDAVFFAGGHGTMEDFPTDASVKTIVESFYRSGKPVASVCHGPACLVAATNLRGEPIISGHHFTCFSDAEERSIGADAHVPFLLESTLTALGGKPDHAAMFAANIVVDRHLITGQNPASSIPVAEAIIQQLRQKIAA
jgi:putative intracellular protease/amidase